MEGNTEEGLKCVLDGNFSVLSITPKFSEVLKFSPDEVIGRKILVDKEVLEKLKKFGKFRGHAVFLDSNQDAVHVECSIEKGENYEVKVKSYFCVDSLLREKVFQKEPDPIMILSKDHTILDVNEATAKLLKKRREELIGEKCYGYMHNTTCPPEGCPLEEAKVHGKSEAINLISTVFGDFVVNVQEVEEGIYVHYAIKEAAVLLETQNRMISLLKRYNRILLTTVEVNTILMAGSESEETLEKVAEKILEIEEFHGIMISVGVENGKSTLVIEKGEVNVPERKLVSVKWPNSFVIEIEGVKNVVLPVKYGGVKGHIIINVGDTRISDDELNILKTMANNIGMYLESRNLDMKREMAHSYMIEAMADFAQLVDRIRNPLAVIMATAEVEMENEELKEKIIQNVSRIQETVRKIDELWNKSEKLREVLKEK